jgi:hypothetical protein
MLAVKETAVGVIRLPFLRAMSLLLVLAAAEAARADDWTFDPPPLARPQGSKLRQPRSGGRDQQPQPTPSRSIGQQAGFFAPASFQPEVVEDSAPPSSPPSALPFSEELPPSEKELLPIAMPDDGGDNPLLPFTPPAPTASSGKWIDRGPWYAQQEAIFMLRSERKGTKLAYDFTLEATASSPLRSTLATSRDLSFGPGAKITIGRFLGRDAQNRDGAVEFTFFGLNNFSSAKGITSLEPNQLASFFDPNFNIGGFTHTNTESYAYLSHFNSYEVNVLLKRRPARDRMVLTRDGTWVRTLSPSFLPTLFGGLRLATINESFNWLSAATDPTMTSGQYNVRTHNTLFGLQGGADYQYRQAEWQVGFRIKGGPFLNFADQFTTVNIVDTTFGNSIRNNSANATPLALMAEINLNAAYFFRPNMAFRFSYDMLFVTDLAVADKQITFTQITPAYLSTTHGLMYQGAGVGFEFLW